MLQGLFVYHHMSDVIDVGATWPLSGGRCVSAYHRPKWRHQQRYCTRLWCASGVLGVSQMSCVCLYGVSVILRINLFEFTAVSSLIYPHAHPMKSPYTKLLMEHFLLSYIDLTDTAILSGLQKNVYPLYDELKELRGLKGVKEHLAYIRDRQDDYSKKNIAKYLKKSIEQYLPIVKRQDIDHE